MDKIISRFPGLAEKIFDSLDDESLVNSRRVSRSWSEFTEDEMFFLGRIIKKLIGGYEDFKETWKLVMKKADKEMMNELTLAVKYFLSKHPGNCLDEYPVPHITGDENCVHRSTSESPAPHHVAAEAGQMSLCEFMMKITKDKNPGMKGWVMKGWTPLHSAAGGGHLLICSMIMDEIQDKNPGNEDGYTPLHAAARGGHLETFKMIMNKAGTDINPSDNEGFTPLHAAAWGGHMLMCSMIMNEIQDKNPGDEDGYTPLHAAAAGGHLETFKMIMNKAGTDINPSDNDGWTPLHAAALRGQREICKFIANEIENKNPEDNDGVTPQELMWANVCEN